MELIFLGTGPVDGIRGHGKSKRFESSALLRTSKTNILIDVTSFFNEQVKLIKHLDVVLITHGHQDAIGGIAKLLRWQREKGIKIIALYSHPQAIQKIKQKFQTAGYLDFVPIISRQKFKIEDVSIAPFLVKHSIQKGFPTLGFHLSFPQGRKLTFVSDTSGWDKYAEKLMKNSEILILDGAMWGKKLVSHLDILQVLPRICSWPVKKIIFTQIGHTAPKHEILQREIKKLCPKALPAYDGMRLKI